MRQLKITKQITQRTDGSINQYFQEINKYSMISAEEEVELSVRIRQGDEMALKKLIVANLRFVISVAKQYQNQGLSFPDLINEGNLGLVKAAKRFDETRGFKFISYAVWWIRQGIMQAISEQTRVVRLPLNRIMSINKISRAIPYLEQELEREPSDDEVAAYLDIPSEDVKTANEIKAHQVSFDMPISSNEDKEYNLYDLIQTSNISPPDTKMNEESVEINIKRALRKLSNREANVIALTFGLYNKKIHSLRDVADKFCMSCERIRQIQSKGLSKLKNILKEKHVFLEY